MTFSHFCEFFRVLPLAFRSRAAKPAEYKTCLLYTSRSDIPEEDWDKYLEQTPASPEDRLVLEQCLKALDDSERQVVILHAVGGMKHRETAELLGLPLATVLSKYSRVIKKLKSKLEKREGI